MYTASAVRDSTLPYLRCGKSGLMLPAALNNTRFTDKELDAIDRASGFAE